MKDSTKLYLSKKGWSNQELNKAESILDKKSKHNKKFSKRVLLSSLLLVIIGNIVSAFILIPFLIFLPNYLLYGFIILLASLIGVLYNMLINDIGNLEKKHHLLASLVLPIVALINMFILVPITNELISKKKLDPSSNPWTIAIVFSIAFILPYLITIIKSHWQKKNN